MVIYALAGSTLFYNLLVKANKINNIIKKVFKTIE